MTPAYLSDAIKRDTGHSPQSLIHAYLVEVAAARLRDTELSVSEIAYELGFTYPNHFTRLFRKVSGQTPQGFRKTICIAREVDTKRSDNECQGIF